MSRRCTNEQQVHDSTIELRGAGSSLSYFFPDLGGLIRKGLLESKPIRAIRLGRRMTLGDS